MYADFGFFLIVDCFAFLEDMLLCLLVVATSPAYLACVHFFVVSFGFKHSCSCHEYGSDLLSWEVV